MSFNWKMGKNTMIMSMNIKILKTQITSNYNNSSNVKENYVSLHYNGWQYMHKSNSRHKYDDWASEIKK